MKQQILYFIFIITLFHGCGISEREKKQAEFDKQKELNEQKFYYPKAHDDWWRFYQPKLKGAEGWISEECENVKFNGEKVIVISESLSHKGWGTYKGVSSKYKCTIFGK